MGSQQCGAEAQAIGGELWTEAVRLAALAEFVSGSMSGTARVYPRSSEARPGHPALDGGICMWAVLWLSYIGRQVMSTRTGISFLMGTVRNEGRSILKSLHVSGMVPVMRT